MTDNLHTDAAQLAATLRERQTRADERLRALSPGADATLELDERFMDKRALVQAERRIAELEAAYAGLIKTCDDLERKAQHNADIAERHEADNVRLRAVEKAAREVSAHADQLKVLESTSMEPNALSDAWELAYTRLYVANIALKAALAGGG